MNHEGSDPDIGLETVENGLKSDGDLFENLRLFVERTMLNRITRAEERNAELGIFARVLLEVWHSGKIPK